MILLVISYLQKLWTVGPLDYPLLILLLLDRYLPSIGQYLPVKFPGESRRPVYALCAVDILCLGIRDTQVTRIIFHYESGRTWQVLSPTYRTVPPLTQRLLSFCHLHYEWDRRDVLSLKINVLFFFVTHVFPGIFL